MNSLMYENVKNLIKEYENKYKVRPNAILLPYFIYDKLNEDYEKEFTRYGVEHNGEYKMFGLDMIPTLDSTDIVPLRIYKEKHADKNEKELRKEIVKDIVKEIEKMAIK